jgi:hypothetical protein
MHPKEPRSSASSDLILLVIFVVYSTQFSVSVSKILANKQLCLQCMKGRFQVFVTYNISRKFNS